MLEKRSTWEWPIARGLLKYVWQMVSQIPRFRKFRFKRYFATVFDQGNEKYGFALEHETWKKQNRIEVTNWQLTYLGKKFTAKTPNVKTFSQADTKKKKRTIYGTTIFAEKPGGMKLGDLASLLYPLPIEIHDPPEEDVRYFKDAETGVRMTSARFSITSHIPIEHIRAYIRGTTLTVRAGF